MTAPHVAAPAPRPDAPPGRGPVPDAPARRAPRLATEDRRRMICEAAIPLILEHGSAITSRQIAEAAGVAEGTVFRAFGDKENLVRAAVEHYFDPEPFRQGLRAIDPGLPLGEKLERIIELFQERLQGVFAMAHALGPRRDLFARRGDDGHEYVRIIARLLEPDAARLSVPPEQVGPLIRSIAFARALPGAGGTAELGVDELARFVQYGIAGAPRAGAPRTEDA